MSSDVFAAELEAPAGYHLGRTMSALRMGARDPALQLMSDRLRLALRAPTGPAALEVVQVGSRLHLSAWGAGAGWLCDRADGLLGLRDRPWDFAPEHPVLRRLQRRFAGTHLPRLPVVLPRVLQVVLLQLVTSGEAYATWGRLVRALGEPAPGPHDLLLPPSGERLAATAEFLFPSLGILPRQGRTLRLVAREERQLERAAESGAEALAARLQAITGVGPWTVQYVLGSALAEADAVLLGDYNLPHTVGWVLAGEVRASEERMLELLEPFLGHRFRVIRWLWMNGVHAPRRGPRMRRRVL